MILEEKNSIYIKYKLIIDDIEVGFIEIIPNSDILEITNVLIYESFRGKGYSKILMNHIFNMKEFTKILLEVNVYNKEAISLYKKYGFKEISVRKNYYKGIEDALVMEVVK